MIKTTNDYEQYNNIYDEEISKYKSKYIPQPHGCGRISTFAFMSKQEIDKTYFVTFCIEQFKEHRGISGAEASKLLFSSGVVEYLDANYEVLHTQSRQWLIEEIEERLNQ